MSNTPTVPNILNKYPKLGQFDIVKDWTNALGKQTPEQAKQDIQNKKPKALSQISGPSHEEEQNIAKVQVAQKLKNPFNAPTPRLQLIASSARTVKIVNDPRFAKLDNQHQEIVLRHHYEHEVEPILRANGIDAPGFERWIQGRHAKSYDKRFASDQRADPTKLGEFTSGVASGTADLARIVNNGLRYKPSWTWTPKFTQNINKAAADKVLSFAHGLDALDQSYHSAFKTDHSVSGWLANTAGHVIGEAPAYILMDAATSGVAPTLEALAGSSKAFGLALRYMREGSEIYAIDRLENKSITTSISDAIVGPLIGVGIGRAGKMVRRGLNKAGEQILNRVNAKGTQLAVMGRPFTETVAHEADKADLLENNTKELPEGTKALPEPKAEVKEPKVQSFIDRNSPAFKAAVKGEQNLRESIAREYYPHKINADNPKASVWRNLSKEQRNNIRLYIKQTTHLAAETMPLTSPHVQTLANAAEIDRFLEENPETKVFDEQISKITNLNPAEVLTSIQAEDVALQFGIDTPAQKLDQAFNTGQENPEPSLPSVSGGSFNAGDSVDYSKRDDNATLKDIISSNGKDFIHKTMKYLEDSPATKSGKIYFEHPEHHLLQIAENSKAPKAIKNKATGYLAREFAHDPLTIKNRAKWLKEHVEDLRRTGKLNTEGNIYRSTRLIPRRYGSRWQRELYTVDSLAAQQDQLKTLLKQNPKLRAVIKPALKELLAIKNKGGTGEVVGERGSALDRMIKAMQEMQ